MTRDPDEPPIEERLGTALRETDATIAVAESCTGGLVGSLLTDVPGSSDYFDRSVVTYSSRAKRSLLAVPREELDAHGAVSAPVARAMARGVRDTADTTWGVATTGIAGPDGGTDEKPVGTVHIGVAYAGEWESGDSAAATEHHVFEGSRREVKRKIARRALTAVLERLDERRNRRSNDTA
ncbi:CinA family protein [Halococcus saccharolyticus]|uniref:Damage inducible protein CinA n=1 Tax=Halococcus saccharolyticus DSM 5350 TaxID=1227455 RepID=M0MKF3_9EURY|nr:CinA family protein [Halococcus saccharolyticus]EMA44920.1 damage inducible protein CinA [Halococcus saccharolyticus DSM 5350]